jgi:hypothetical protein
MTNLEQHSWQPLYEVFRQVNFAELKESDLDPVSFIKQIWPLMVYQSDLEMKYPAVKELLVSDRTFDVVCSSRLPLSVITSLAEQLIFDGH